jgi:hypothetical protein
VKEVAPPVVLRVPPSELMTTTRHVMPLVPELHSTELSDPAREALEMYVSPSAYTAPEDTYRRDKRLMRNFSGSRRRKRSCDCREREGNGAVAGEKGRVIDGEGGR